MLTKKLHILKNPSKFVILTLKTRILVSFIVVSPKQPGGLQWKRVHSFLLIRVFVQKERVFINSVGVVSLTPKHVLSSFTKVSPKLLLDYNKIEYIASSKSGGTHQKKISFVDILTPKTRFFQVSQCSLLMLQCCRWFPGLPVSITKGHSNTICDSSFLI